MTLLPLQLVLASAFAAALDSDNVVLEFTAEKHCRPCQQASPVVHKLQREGLPIRKIDVYEQRELAQRFQIEGMPTFVVLVEGREVAREQGLKLPQTGEPIETQLRRLCALIPKKDTPEHARPPMRELPKRAPAFSEPIIVSNDTPQPVAAANAAPSRAVEDDSVAAALASTPAGKPRTESKPLFGFFGRKNDSVPAKPAVTRTQNEDFTSPGEQVAGIPLQASVRIRVKDSQGGQDYGSGTIIDSRDGQALVLTCGHIFRHLDQHGAVEVDVFVGDRYNTFVGKVQKFDLEAEVGLVRIAADLLPVCRVAPPKTAIQKGLPVETVGCSGGERPTVQAQNVTALNRYRDADNIHCSVVPVQGRSGGGLFTRNGQLIGICTNADPHYREGIYASLNTVHQFLDECQLTHVYRPAGTSTSAPHEAPADLVPAGRPQTLLTASVADKSPATPRKRLPDDETELAHALTEANAGALFDADVDPEDALGSEIVIIIRPRSGQQKNSKIVMLHRASRNFVEYLTGELDAQDSILETSLAGAIRPSAGPRTQARRPIAAAETATQPEAPRGETDIVEADAYRRR